MAKAVDQSQQTKIARKVVLFIMFFIAVFKACKGVKLMPDFMVRSKIEHSGSKFSSLKSNCP
jgi:hypothetical protein